MRRASILTMLILLLILIAPLAMAGGSLSFGAHVSKTILTSNVHTASLDLTFDNSEGLSALQFRVVASRSDMVLRGAVRGAAIIDAQRWGCASNVVRGPLADTLIVLFWSRTLTPLAPGSYPALISVSYDIPAGATAVEGTMALSDITSALGDGHGTTGSIGVGEIPAAVIQTELPGTFALDQNFPNPFNPTTKIGYRISGLGSVWVNLSVYDILGREVAVLVHEPQTAGSYEVNFKAAGLSSGTYVYRLAAGANVNTRTMILVK